MKKIVFKCAIIIALTSLVASCAMTRPVAVSYVSIGTKRGVSTTMQIGPFQLNKNYGIKEAATNGGITGGIAAIDEKITNYIVIQKKELIVLGK